MIVETYYNNNNKLMTFADLCIGDTFEILDDDRYSNKLCIKTNNEWLAALAGSAIYYNDSDKTWHALTARADTEVKKIKSKLVVEN